MTSAFVHLSPPTVVVRTAPLVSFREASSMTRHTSVTRCLIKRRGGFDDPGLPVDNSVGNDPLMRGRY